MIAPRIHLLFDVGQQIRRVLDLVVDHWRRVERQKPTRITARRGAHIGRLQGDDRPLRTDHVFQQRGLAGLARADQNDDGKLGHGPGKDRFQAPGDVVLGHRCSFRAYLQLYCKYARKANWRTVVVLGKKPRVNAKPSPESPALSASSPASGTALCSLMIFLVLTFNRWPRHLASPPGAHHRRRSHAAAAGELQYPCYCDRSTQMVSPTTQWHPYRSPKDHDPSGFCCSGLFAVGIEDRGSPCAVVRGQLHDKPRHRAGDPV